MTRNELNIEITRKWISLAKAKIEENYEKKLFKKGRKRTFPIEMYLKYIMYVLETGITWNNLIDTPCKPNTIRKQYGIWVGQGIFDDIHKELLTAYDMETTNQSSPLLISENNLFIDSTDIQNRNGTEKITGFGIKFKNKRAMKIHSLCDENKVSYSFVLTPANCSDSTVTENVIDSSIVPLHHSNHNKLRISGDKGYINRKTRDKLRDDNIILVTPPRRNQYEDSNRTRRKRVRGLNKKCLKKRINVEHSYSLLKRSYKRVNYLYERKLKHFYNFLLIANSCIVLRNFIKCNMLPNCIKCNNLRSPSQKERF